jgi:hypothetical protein
MIQLNKRDPRTANLKAKRAASGHFPTHWYGGLGWLQLMSAGGVGIYLVWFFAQSGYFGGSRLQDLIGLLLPDELVRSTTGGQAEHLQMNLWDRVPVFLAASTWLAVAYWIGRPVVRPLQGLVTWPEELSLGTLIGLSMLSTTTLLVGLAGWLDGRWILIPVLLLCLASFALKRFLASQGPKATVAQQPTGQFEDRIPLGRIEELSGGQGSRWLWRMVQVSTVLLVGIYALSSAMPPYEFDVVEYHLQGPKEYYKAGGISFSAHNVYMNMPLGAEMHSLAAMLLIGGDDAWWSGALVGKLITGCFSLISVALAAGFAARHFGKASGWAAAALILAAPGNIHEAGCGLVDSVLGAYILATCIALHCLIHIAMQAPTQQAANESSRDHQLERAGRWSQAAKSSTWATSLLAGSCLACKYTGLVFLGLPAAGLLLAVALRAGSKAPIASLVRSSIILIIGMALTGGPWLVKNAADTGNPVFPLAQKWFGDQVPGWSSAQTERWNRAHRVPAGPGIPGWVQPTSAYSVGSLAGGIHQLLVGSPMLPPMLVPLALIGLAVCGRFPNQRRTASPAEANGWGQLIQYLAGPGRLIGLVLLWILAVWWLATHRIDRFWLPGLPLAAVLGAAGFRWLLEHWRHGIAAGLLLLSNIFGIYMTLTGALCDQRWLVSYESLRWDAGLDDQPGRIPKTTAWINRNLSKDDHVLMIGEARVFDFIPKISYATCFNAPPGESALRGRAAGEQLSWLHEQKVSHLFVHWGEIARYRAPGNYGFSSWPDSAAIQQMITEDVLQPVADWPFDHQEVTLLEVGGSGDMSGGRSGD